MNKKGQEFSGAEIIKYGFIYTVFLSIIIVSMLLVVNFFITTTIDTKQTDAYVFMGRVFYDQGYISDYPGLFYQNKFDSGSGVFYPDYGEDLLAAQFTKDNKYYHYNYDLYSELEVYKEAGLTEGLGGVTSTSQKFGLTKIEVLTSNS